MKPTNDDQKSAPRWRLLVVGGLALLILGVVIGRMGSPEPVAESKLVPEVAALNRKGGNVQRPTSLLPDRHDSPSQVQKQSAVEPEGPGGIADALGISIASLREAALLQSGFAMGESDVESALKHLESIEEQSDRDAFLRGVFAGAMNNRSLRDIYQLAGTLEDADRAGALYAALETMTGGRPETRERAEIFEKRFGVEAGIGLALSLDPVFRPEYANDWIEAFADNENRGVVIGSFASLRAGEDFDAALKMGAHLTGWDREMFFRALGDGWSQLDPAQAWEWVGGHAGENGPGATVITGKILRNWARKDFEAANRAFEELRDPEKRLAGARSLALVQTWDSGTAAAVNWANQLPSDAEIQVAHDAIAEFSPQGIGVALGLEGGFAVINKVIPQGAAARNGQLQQGDRIVEVDPGTGQFQTIYGRDLTQAISLIRGESGSRMRLRVVRQDENGNFRDRVVELTREQIVLEGG